HARIIIKTSALRAARVRLAREIFIYASPFETVSHPGALSEFKRRIAKSRASYKRAGGKGNKEEKKLWHVYLNK
ncbi:MAG: hypothetical protein ABFD07_10545, partial [Methanobacterium sp.]